MSADGFGAPGGAELITVDAIGGNVSRHADDYPLAGERYSVAHFARLQDRLDWLERRWEIFMRLSSPDLRFAVEAAATLLERGQKP